MPRNNPTFHVTLLETRQYKTVYEVVARDADEANDKVMRGEGNETDDEFVETMEYKKLSVEQVSGK